MDPTGGRPARLGEVVGRTSLSAASSITLGLTNTSTRATTALPDDPESVRGPAAAERLANGFDGEFPQQGLCRPWKGYIGHDVARSPSCGERGRELEMILHRIR